MPSLQLAPASFEDYRLLAERRLPRVLFDYIDGGAYDERTLAANVADFHSIRVKQRVMHDVSTLDTQIDLLGHKWSMPVALAPIGMAGMMARRAETQAKRAADSFGIPYCLSTVGICSLEEVAAVSDIPFWFQLYMLRDRGAVRNLLDRAHAVGVKTLVFTVDLAVVGSRYRDVRNGLAPGVSHWGRLRSGLLDYMLHPKWLLDVGIKGKPHIFGNLTEYVPKATTPADFKEWVDSQFDPSVTWKDIEWLRTIWKGDLVIKGVLNSEDARAARNAGADAVIVSNHGGRQLDGVSSSIAILPQIADAVDGSVDLLLDGGIRSGLDVAKALALGAKAVLVGRPWVYAVASKGEAGLKNLLSTMKDGLDVSMALTGAPSIKDLSHELLEIK